MKKLRVSALLLGLLLGSAAHAEDWEPSHVLFVGNSYTYYNNSLHNHYKKLVLAANDGKEPEGRIRSSTISGGQLPEHKGLPAMLETEPWDVVILQGHSRGPISKGTGEAFRKAAREFVPLIREQGARPVFFMTWAYSDKPEMTEQLDNAYTSIGASLGADVAPVGLAFATVTSERPDIELRIADRSHPTVAGTYLAACVFYSVLHESSPAGLAYDAGLDPDVAAYLQRTAWNTVVDYRNREAGMTSADFEFTNWDGPAFNVRMSKPASFDEDTPIVIVMHGASRDVDRYFADWSAQGNADGFAVVVPHLDDQGFPGSDAYNLGNVFSGDGMLTDKGVWTFTAIEPLFDEAAARLGSRRSGYTLFGHSAGSQFAHRFLYHVPNARAERVIAANAGWYTMPDFGVIWPYGLAGSGMRPEDLPGVLARDVVVLLGDADNDPNGAKFRKTPEAELQGEHRLARGKTFYRVAEARAQALGVPFNWQLEVVPGAGHVNAEMTPAAAAWVK